jgi:hypothetical protein
MMLTHSWYIGIHDRFVAHGDLCPENIRFISTATVSESWYDLEKGYFRDQVRTPFLLEFYHY